MNETKKAKIILSVEKLRLIESELFRLTSKYGVKTVGELDSLVAKGKLSEDIIGDDLFVFDNLLSEKEKVERELYRLDNTPDKKWTIVATFPIHFHNMTYVAVGGAPFSVDQRVSLESVFRRFLSFV